VRYPAALISLCVSVVLLLVAGPGPLPAEETQDEAQKITLIIDKVIDAYGGKEVVDGIHSLHAKGKIEAFMLHDHGTYELYFKRERKLRVETKYGRGFEVRVLNGDKGYRGSDTRPIEEVSGPRFYSMVYHYKHLDIIHDLAKGVYQIHSAGTSLLRGNKVKVLRLNDKEGAMMDIYVDAQNSLIVKVAAYFTEGNKNMDLSSEFSDFRKVGGSVFPFTITNYAGGMKIAQTVIEKYSLNPDIADSFFAPSLIHSL
jgi:hypothetical protein